MTEVDKLNKNFAKSHGCWALSKALVLKSN